MDVSPQRTTQPVIIEPERPRRGPWRLFWERLRKQRIAMIGGVILVVLYTLALLAGFVAPYNYQRMDRERFFHSPTALAWDHGLAVAGYELKSRGPYQYVRVPGRNARLKWFVHGDRYRWLGLVPTDLHLFGSANPGVPVYLLGTDQYGRDILSRLLYGSQISLSIGLLGILLSFGFGTILGGISGYTGGRTDTVIMRLCELIMSIPGLYLIISLRATFPPGLTSREMYALMVVILSFIGWASTARVLRGMALSLRERPFVLASRALGQSTWKIIVRHIVPNTFSYLVVAATLSVPYYILGEVVLSFLGVGIQEPDASWGIMLSAAQNVEYLRNYPWLLAPGGAIFITVLAFNFLGDGLRDAVDTRTSAG